MKKIAEGIPAYTYGSPECPHRPSLSVICRH